MSVFAYPEILAQSAADGTALTNSTTATSIIPTAAICNLPAGSLQVGRMFWVRAAGRISTVVTTPGTLTLDVRFGSVTAWASGAMTLNTTAQTNTSWLLDLMLTVRAVGSGTSANLIGIGSFKSRAIVASPAEATGGAGSRLVPDSAPAVGTGFDSTAAQNIDFRATWSVASASNSITCHQYMFAALS